MTFTINVPVFPMRKEVEARRMRGHSHSTTHGNGRRRSRDADGFLELELLPLEEIGRGEMVRSRPRKGLRALLPGCASRN